ncbi:hypothetical protein OEZ86_013177 [Tetradesmus obliquus]|nr:hypothetical protein OEZ86_013177 [Tetradesmus obliquus]
MVHVSALQPTCTNNTEVEPMGSCAPAVKDGCGGNCELKCSSKSQCMFGAESFVEVGVCVPFPEPTNCYRLGLPPALEFGEWDNTCYSTPIKQNCTATCPDKYQPGSSGAPTSTCTVDRFRGLVWSEPVGSCELVPALDCTGQPAKPKNGAWSCGSTTADGAVCRGTCDNGYTMAGVLSATCTNGAWSATSGMCVNTPPPPNPNVADFSLTDCGIEGRDVVATSTLILQRDDDWALLTLPFEFTSYGTAYSNLGVSCNGYLTFGAAGTDACYYTSLWTDPADRADCVPLNSPAVAIFLTDVVPDSVLYYSDENTDDPSNPYIIIQYTMSTIYNSSTHLGQFQIYMFKNGDIGFIYNTIYAWPESKGERAVVGIMSPDNSGTRTFNMFSEGEQKLKPGLALLFKPKGVDGYESAVTWTDAVKYVKFVQNPGAPPRPVITFPAANAVVKSQT